MADVVSGLWRKNPDHIGYAKYYLYHMARFILSKCGRTMPPATRLRCSDSFFPNHGHNLKPGPERDPDQPVSSEPVMIFREGN